MKFLILTLKRRVDVKISFSNKNDLNIVASETIIQNLSCFPTDRKNSFISIFRRSCLEAFTLAFSSLQLWSSLDIKNAKLAAIVISFPPRNANYSHTTQASFVTNAISSHNPESPKTSSATDSFHSDHPNTANYSNHSWHAQGRIVPNSFIPFYSQDPFCSHHLPSKLSNFFDTSILQHYNGRNEAEGNLFYI